MEDRLHYLYQHRRLDKNEIFYVGIGTTWKNHKNPESICYYQRAYTDTLRNDIWYNIVAKTSWVVEILFESNDYEFIKNQEIGLIALHGRKIYDVDGSLANITSGGDGTKGIKYSTEHRKRLSELKKGKNKGEENPLSKKVINIVTNKIYSTVTEAALENNYDTAYFVKMLAGKRINHTDCFYLEDYKNNNFPFKESEKQKIFDVGLGFIFNSTEEASLFYGIKPATLRYRIRSKSDIWPILEYT